MAPKEPTRNQYSKGLGYVSHTPAFLLQLQQRVGGTARQDDLISDDGRPPIPTRPEGESSGDEEDADEKPQVIVLKEGKHLSALDVENEKRKSKGLDPLPEHENSGESRTADMSTAATSSIEKPTTKPSQSLSFSSNRGSNSSQKKRKVIGDVDGNSSGKDGNPGRAKKKGKKESKSLLSFGDGGD